MIRIALLLFVSFTLTSEWADGENPTIPPNPRGAEGRGASTLCVVLTEPQFLGLVKEKLVDGDIQLYSVEGSKSSFILVEADTRILLAHKYIELLDLKSLREKKKNGIFYLSFRIEGEGDAIYKFVVRIADGHIHFAGRSQEGGK